MPSLLHFSEKIGIGATIELDSGEPCIVSVARSGVLVKKSKSGFFGDILYNEKDSYRAGMTALELRSLFPETLLPLGFKNPVLISFANAIWHCSSCAQVTSVINDAVGRAKKQHFWK